MVVFASITYVNFLNTPVYQGMEAKGLSEMLSLNYQLPSKTLSTELIEEIEDEIGVEFEPSWNSNVWYNLPFSVNDKIS